MKKLLLAIFALFIFCTAFAAETVPVAVQGKNKKPIEVRQADGQMFVEARSMAKYLHLQSNLFWNSGQLNLRGTAGFFATLRQGEQSVTVKGNPEDLAAAPFMEKKEMFVPLSFFTEGAGLWAGNYQAAFDGTKIIVEPRGHLPQIEKIERNTSLPPPSVTAKQDNNTTGIKNTDNKKTDSKNADNEKTGQVINLPPPSVTAKAQVTDADEDEDLEELGGEFFAQIPRSTIPAPTVINKLDTSAKNKPFVPKNLHKESVLRVCIDAGHGGKDPGANYRGSAKEKELNLIVAKEVEKLLKKNKKIEIKMTRRDDTFIPLGTRATIANNFKADLFVSIHANAAPNKNAKGFEIYFRSDKASDKEAAQTAALENEALNYEEKGVGSITYADLLLNSLAANENINESSKLAARIRNSVSEKSSVLGIKVNMNNSIKQANFYVLQGVKAPSVLVEMGYVTNKDDKRRLNNKKILQIMALSIYNGILNYARQEGWKI